MEEMVGEPGRCHHGARQLVSPAQHYYRIGLRLVLIGQRNADQLPELPSGYGRPGRSTRLGAPAAGGQLAAALPPVSHLGRVPMLTALEAAAGGDAGLGGGAATITAARPPCRQSDPATRLSTCSH